MVLGHTHRRLSLTSNRSSTDETRPDSAAAEDETVVDSEQGSILSHIVSQLRPGADLSRVTLPTFFLEPRSMLERITNFMAHPEILLEIPTIDDPVQRFISVVKFYLSGWHIKPPGVKKPLNPILGEIFTGYWEYADNTKGYYIAEQTSHHPPKSSYFFMAPEHHIRIDGTLKPRSRFLGNSAASMMEGIAIMRFLNRGERFFITQPNMYARGVLFGKMKYELGDHSFVRCPESGLVADLEFKTKGYFSGTYNAIGGYIKDAKTDKQLYELSGLWNGEMYIKDLMTNKKELLFDATHARETRPSVRPLEDQGERESQNLWKGVTDAIRARDQDAATDRKSAIEDQQREEASKRANQGIEWRPTLFRAVHGGPGGTEEGEEDLDWIINAHVDHHASPEEQVKQVLAIAPILPGQKADARYAIKQRRHTQTSVTSDPSSHPHPNPNSSSNSNSDLTSAKSQANPPPVDTTSHANPPPVDTTPQPTEDDLLTPKAGPRDEATLPPNLLNATLKDGHFPRAEAPPVQRSDSQTSDMDEFHDALS